MSAVIRALRALSSASLRRLHLFTLLCALKRTAPLPSLPCQLQERRLSRSRLRWLTWIGKSLVCCFLECNACCAAQYVIV